MPPENTESNIDYTLDVRRWAREYAKIYKSQGRDKAGIYLVNNVPEAKWSELRKYTEMEFARQGIESQRPTNDDDKEPA